MPITFGLSAPSVVVGVMGLAIVARRDAFRVSQFVACVQFDWSPRIVLARGEVGVISVGRCAAGRRWLLAHSLSPLVERRPLYLGMMRSFRFKVRLSAGCIARADRQLRLLRELYNAALEERRDHWKRGVRVNFFTQCRQLTAIRAEMPEYAAIDRMVAETTLRKLDRAFDNFFRRVKEGGKPGYPRFKGRDRFNSMTYRQTGFKVDGRYVTLRGIGRIKLHLSREIEGTIKTVTLKRDATGDWFVTFACDGVPARPLPATGRSVGVDLGLATFAATSDGELIENPRHLRGAESDVARANRRVARRKRGGTRRRKAATVLARKHRRVASARRDFHFKAAVSLVRSYDRIAVEDLNVRALSRSRFAKSVNDAGWGQFLHALATKAESAGREMIVVDCRGTSQECSGCGAVVPKGLSVRTHVCACGLTLDRDVNAARNILARAGPSGSGRRSQAAA